MKNLRTYGAPPFTVAVLHGGPGAPGQMAPVARELAIQRGVLEPLQTKDTLEGQIKELRSVIEKICVVPVSLIGSSWGAMLGFLFTAYFPQLVKKLILVGSGVFDKKYADKIQRKRLSRLNENERQKVQFLIEALSLPDIKEKDGLFGKLGELLTKADAYNPMTLETEVIETQYALHLNVWKDAEKLRNSGGLLKLGERIQCPVIVIHGDYDSHPVEGVAKPLSGVIHNFRFILLKNCGHLPWIEKEAQTEFYEILNRELSNK